MAVNIIIFSQNVKLYSFQKVVGEIDLEHKIVLLTSHKLLENEKKYMANMLGEIECITFGELLSDVENETIDKNAYSDDINILQYYRTIMISKNEKIYEKVVQRYGEINKGYVCCADLGIYRLFWLSKGFIRLDMDYYHNKIDSRFDEFWVTNYEGKKLIFIGKLSRIGYRMNLSWEHSIDDYIAYINGDYLDKGKCQYLTTLHEAGKVRIPDNDSYDVRYIQDGYLPPNYTSLYLKFKPNNVSYYAWDTMSMETFNYSGVHAEIMPFRRVLELPKIRIKKKLEWILVSTSGPGDWTAQKNRSDEDYAIENFVRLAQNNPNLQIIYRCHPTWVHPEHNGVNSIERIKEYIQYMGVKNIIVSENIPKEELSSFVLSFERSSLDQDLENVDLVMGEHSVSMIDGGLKGIPFASYNFTRRRNLFEGITRFGFPHCESIDDVQRIIDNYETDEFADSFNSAVDKYNQMIHEL